MATGRYASEDDLLREAFRALAEEESGLRVVQEAIDEWQAGDEGIDLRAAFDEVRAAVDRDLTR